MKLNKKILTLSVGVILTTVFAVTNNQTNVTEAQAADNSVQKTVMHTAVGYDRNGKNTGIKLYPYKTINVDATPVLINNQQYYKVTGKYLYIKPTNVDGVTRKITHNTYIYSSSTKRTSFNGKWKLYKGETITTYGSSYKFKNGKSYFKIGGPTKQYVKSANVGSIIGTNTTKASKSVENNEVKETTVTVHARSTYKKSAPIFTFDKNKKAVLVKNVPNGTKFTVDRLEYGSRADAVAEATASFNGNQAIYHIKGTNNWIYSIDVDAKEQLPEQLYNE